MFFDALSPRTASSNISFLFYLYLSAFKLLRLMEVLAVSDLDTPLRVTDISSSTTTDNLNGDTSTSTSASSALGYGPYASSLNDSLSSSEEHEMNNNHAGSSSMSSPTDGSSNDSSSSDAGQEESSSSAEDREKNKNTMISKKKRSLEHVDLSKSKDDAEQRDHKKAKPKLSA
jgi:hypothetical protein